MTVISHFTKLWKNVKWSSKNRPIHTCYFVIHNSWFSPVIAPWKQKFVLIKHLNPFICILSERFYPVCDPFFLISDQLNDTGHSSRMLIKLPKGVKVLQSSWELQLSKYTGSQPLSSEELFLPGGGKTAQTTSDWSWNFQVHSADTAENGFIICMKLFQCICSRSTGGSTNKEKQHRGEIMKGKQHFYPF